MYVGFLRFERVVNAREYVSLVEWVETDANFQCELGGEVLFPVVLEPRLNLCQKVTNFFRRKDVREIMFTILVTLLYVALNYSVAKNASELFLFWFPVSTIMLFIFGALVVSAEAYKQLSELRNYESQARRAIREIEFRRLELQIDTAGRRLSATQERAKIFFGIASVIAAILTAFFGLFKQEMLVVQTYLRSEEVRIEGDRVERVPHTEGEEVSDVFSDSFNFSGPKSCD